MGSGKSTRALNLLGASNNPGFSITPARHHRSSLMAAQPQISWHDRAKEIRPRGQAFINGKYVDAASGETFDCISPIDGRLLAKVASCDSADVDRAVTAARAAFNKGSWSRKAPAQRKRVLVKL